VVSENVVSIRKIRLQTFTL